MIDRTLFAQLAIIFAVCIGGWMMVAQPVVQEINHLETAIRNGRAHAAHGAHASPKALAARLSGVRQRLAGVRARNTMAQSSQLYGVIMDLAVAHDVVVQRLQPGGELRKTNEEGVQVNQIDMTVEGAYQRVAEFLDAIAEVPGFLRPAALQVTPFVRDGRALVMARFSCEALHFDYGQELAQMETTADAEQ